MKTHLWMHPWLGAAVLCGLSGLPLPLCADSTAPAVVENLTFNGQINQETAKFMVQGTLKGAGGELAEPRPVYSLHALSRMRLDATTNFQTAEFIARLHQGKLKELVLAMSGTGEVVRVTGPEVKDWSVRHGTNGQSFLIIRPREPDRTTNELAVTVESQSRYESLPATLTPLALSPENAALYDGLLEVVPSEAVELSITQVKGLTSVQDTVVTGSSITNLPAAPNPALAFRFSGSDYSLTIEVRAADPERRRVRFEQFQLTGELGEQMAAFVLNGVAVVRHPEGGMLPILRGDAAVVEFPADRELQYTNGGYWLVFRQTGSYPVQIKFNARIQSQDGWKGVAFEVAPSALRPVVLKGLPAETQFQLANAAAPERGGQEFTGYLPPAGPLSLRWKEARPEVEGKLFYAVQGTSQMAVGPGLIREAHLMEFKVMQGELSRLILQITGEGEITRVQGEGILTWRVEKSERETSRQLVVQLNQPRKDTYRLVVQTQTPLGKFPQKIQPLRLAPAGAIRFGGHVLVVNDGAVRLEVLEPRGLSQISPELFPQTKDLASLLPAQRTQAFAYRFSGADFALAIQAEDIQPEVSVSQLLVYHLRETETVIEAETELDIREAPLREFALVIPGDYTVSRVNVAQLSDYVVTPDPATRTATLKLLFAQPLAGRQVVELRLERNQDLSTNLWNLPAIQPQGIKSLRGYVGVTADTGLRLQPGALEGLTDIATAFFPRKVAGLQVAYRLRDARWQAVMKIERMPVSVQVDAFHLFSVSEGLAYGSSVLNYVISGTPVGVLKVEVPAEYSNLEWVGKDVRNWKRTGTNCEIYLHTPVFGAYTLLATFDRKFNPTGETLSFTGIRPLEVQSERGSVVVVSEFQFEVKPAEVSANLVQWEPAEIPAENRLLFDAPILAAYQYAARPYSLRLELHSLAQGESVHQVVDRAVVQTRVSREGEVMTQADYFIKSQGFSHLRLTVPDAVRLWETRINGAKVVPVADGKDTLVPLPQNLDASTILRLGLMLAAKSPSPERVMVRLPALGAPVLFSEWRLTPDDGYYLQFRRGTIDPDRSAADRSGFAWIGKMVGGEFGTFWRASFLAALVLLLAGALALRWATSISRVRFDWQNTAGLATGVVATMLAIYLLVQLLVFARQHPIATSPGLAFMAPVQDAGRILEVQVRNLPKEAIGPSVWGAWPAFGGLLLWMYVGLKLDQGLLKRLGGLLGWGFLCWGAVRLTNGAPAFFAVLLAFLVFQVWWPFWRGQRALPPKPSPLDPSATGAVVAALLLVLGASGPGAWAETAPMVPEFGSTVPWLSQETHYQEGKDAFVTIKAKMQWKVVAGQSLDFLRSPAVLMRIDYPTNAVQLTETRVQNQPVYRLTARQSGAFEIAFEYQAPVTQQEGATGFHLPVFLGLVNRFHLELEGAGVDVISPEAVSIQTTHAPGRDGINSTNRIASETTSTSPTGALRPGQEWTRADLVLAPATNAWIAWKPRARDTRLETTVFYVELQQLYIPTPGVVEGVYDLQVRPAQGQLGDMTFQVPAGFTMTDVQALFVSGWRFDPDTRTLQVQFQAPQSRPFSLRLVSQLTASSLPYEQSVGILRVAKAAGQVGMLGVATGSDVQLDRYQETDLAAVNLEDFPDALVKDLATRLPGLTLRRAFRYSGAAAQLKLAASAVQPDVRVETQETLSLGEDRTVLAAQVQVAITRAGIFKLSFGLPAGMEVESLTGAALSHWTETTVEAERIVTLHLRGKTEGDQAFAIALAGPGIASRRSWEASRLVLREASKQSGQLLIVPELGLRLHVLTRDGLTQLDPQKAGLPQKGAQAFRLLHSRWQLSFEVESVEPWIEAAVLQDVTVREGSLLVVAQIDYQIQNAGVKSLLLQLPAAAENVRFQGEQVADTLKGNLGATGLVDWEVKLQRRIIGRYALRVTWQLSAAGQPTAWTLSGIQARNANLQRGYLAVRASGRLQVTLPQIPAALQRAEWQSIPLILRRGAETAEAKETFRVIEPVFTVAAQVSRHEVARLLPARVEEVNLRSVISPSGVMLTEARLMLQPGDKRLLRVKLPAGSRFWHAFVNQESVWPWQEGNETLLKLERNPDPQRLTTVEFFYTRTVESRSFSGFNRLLAGPQFDLPLENITWQVFVPESWNVKDWKSTLQLREDSQVPVPVTFNVQAYLAGEAEQQKTKTQQAETLLQAGNDFLQKGVPSQARKAFESAWRLSQHDAAFNEDARVQWHNLKMQQALLGLNQRRLGALDNPEGRSDAGGAGMPLGSLMPGQPPGYTQQQVQQVLEKNSTEENTVLMQLAERLVRQQEAAVAKPTAIRAAVPQYGRLLTFAGSVQVDPWADLNIKLATQLKSTGAWKLRLWIALLTLAGLAILAGVTRPITKSNP